MDDKITSEIASLKNLGPKSAAWLNQAGIYTLQQLQTLGAIEAYRRVIAQGIKPSLNLLYALEGAIQNKHWTALDKDEKASLIMAADALTEEQKP